VRKGSSSPGFLASTGFIGAHASSVEAALFGPSSCRAWPGSANSWRSRRTLIPASVVGRVTGVQNFFGASAGIVGPLLTGWLKEISGGYQAPMQAIWFFLVLGILACVFLLREKYSPMRLVSEAA
jgi:uncharacterized membrane protein